MLLTTQNEWKASHVRDEVLISSLAMSSALPERAGGEGL